MNKTKRKIFETSMKLFAEKGYEATSIEEITATVGVAKGTLYYHFSSKEEIFNFLIDFKLIPIRTCCIILSFIDYFYLPLKLQFNYLHGFFY